MQPHPALLREPALTPGPALAAAATTGVAAAVAFAGSALVAWCGPVDPPARRTSHLAPTPTSGGVAVLAAAAAGLLAWALTGASGPAPVDRLVLLGLALALTVGALGALDDMVDLGALPKLAGIGVAAGAMALAALPRLGGLIAPFAALPPLHAVAALALLGAAAAWLVLSTNAVNFMDGADGLVAGALAVGFAGLTAAAAGAGRPWPAGAALAACAAFGGFLPWNLGGRLFQGDVGALGGGFLFAALSLAVAEATGPLFGPLAILPLLVDVGLTLLRRGRAGRPLMQAHREHLYQRWLQATGRSHAALAARVWMLTAAGCALALVVAGRPLAVQAGVLALAAVALAAGWDWLSRRVDRQLTARPS